jgi:hypothetical protein
VDEEVPIAARDEANDAFKQFQAIYGPPAYIRRALRVEGALTALLERCQQQREAWLPMVRLRLGLLRALAGDWNVLRPLVGSEDDVFQLQRLHGELSPTLRVQVSPTTSRRQLRNALRELCESLELFNRRWARFLPGLDLTEINELRDSYNRYYVLEKECAVRSPRLAREGFVPLKPLTHDDLWQRLPLLPVPVVK